MKEYKTSKGGKRGLNFYEPNFKKRRNEGRSIVVCSDKTPGIKRSSLVNQKGSYNSLMTFTKED